MLEQLNQSEAKLFSSDAAVYFSTSATATCSIGLDFFTSVFDSLHTGTRVIYRHIARTVPDCRDSVQTRHFCQVWLAVFIEDNDEVYLLQMHYAYGVYKAFSVYWKIKITKIKVTKKWKNDS